MEPLLAIAVSLVVLYGGVCGLVADDADAPRWLRWPTPVWHLIAHSWRRQTPVPRRPDYARIAALERELGIGDPPAMDLSPFEEGLQRGMQERPMRHGNLCLTKGCAGATSEIRTWSGVLMRRVHECEAP